METKRAGRKPSAWRSEEDRNGTAHWRSTEKEQRKREGSDQRTILSRSERTLEKRTKEEATPGADAGDVFPRHENTQRQSG